jgi:pilus assembly protein Flp/PilA
MRPLTKPLARFQAAEDGPTAVEYAAMLALLIVVCSGAVTAVGTKTCTR